MKYCPYCGAEIKDGAASFCAECGKKLTDSASSPPYSAPPKGRGIPSCKKKAAKKPRKPKKVKKPKIKSEEKPTEPEITEKTPSEPVNDDYDGYYDDVLPQDSGAERQALDKELIKKLVLLIAGVIVTIVICVAVIYLL